MKKNYFNCNCKLPMDLQFFAESGDNGDDGGADGGNGSGSETGGDGGNKNSGQSFDDFLKTAGNQAEFDRRLQKAVNTAVSNAQEKWKAMTDDKLSEADRLAKMTKDEKTQYLQQKREKELSDREAAVTRKELKAEAKNTLAADSLPIELAEILDYSNADSCKTSMETVKKAFQNAVQSAVESKLKGDKPLKKATEDTKTAQEDLIMKLMMGR